MKARTIGVSAIALALVGLTPALAAHAAAPPKVTICHVTASATNPWELIEVPTAALGAHEGHGDLVPAPVDGCPATVAPPPTEEEPLEDAPPVVTPPVIVTPTEPIVTLPPQTYTLTAWEMPAWVDATTATWPQSYETSVVQTSPALHALDVALPCGSQFQIDVYITGPVTSALIAGGTLHSPGNPPEALLPGGWGVAYKLVQTAPCAPAPVVEQHEASECASTTSLTTRTWTTTNGQAGPVTTTTRPLDRVEAISLGCYTPPVTDCKPGTVPGWLNEHGDATSCVSDEPCPDMGSGSKCPTDEPPVVTPPVETAPVAARATTPDELAHTGGDVAPGLVAGGLAVAAGLALVVGSLIRRRSILGA